MKSYLCSSIQNGLWREEKPEIDFQFVATHCTIKPEEYKES